MSSGNKFKKIINSIKVKYNNVLGENVTTSRTMRIGQVIQLTGHLSILVGFSIWLFSTREYVDEDKNKNPDPIVMSVGLKMIAAGGILSYIGSRIRSVVYNSWSTSKLVKMSSQTVQSIVNQQNTLDLDSIGRLSLSQLRAVWTVNASMIIVGFAIFIMDSQIGIGTISVLLGGLGMAIGGLMSQSSHKELAYLLGWEKQGNKMLNTISDDGVNLENPDEDPETSGSVILDLNH